MTIFSRIVYFVSKAWLALAMGTCCGNHSTELGALPVRRPASFNGKPVYH